MQALEYSQTVADHFAQPRNAGEFQRAANVVTAAAGTRSSGIQISLSARIEGRRILALCHRVYGCPHSIAAASWLSERLIGAERSELENWHWREVAEALGFPAEKLGRLLVLEDAVRSLARAWLEEGL